MWLNFFRHIRTRLESVSLNLFLSWPRQPEALHTSSKWRTILHPYSPPVRKSNKGLGCASLFRLNKLISKDLVVNLPSIKYNDGKVCDPCAKGKQVKNSFKSKKCLSTSQPLQMLHIHLCGPMRIMSRGGKRYVCVIVDGHSHFTWTLVLASKDETFENFVAFLKKVEKRVYTV